MRGWVGLIDEMGLEVCVETLDCRLGRLTMMMMLYE
jgi:hypothetical protein